MAREQQTQTNGTDETLLGRRSYLRYAGAAAAAVAGGAAASGSATAQSDARTLDISDGETIDPYLENIGNGETVTVPPGTYDLEGTTVSADNWQLDAQGATFVPQGYARLKLRGSGWQFGHVRFDTSGGNNLTLLPRGGDWRVHNCAWDGPNTGGETVDFLFSPKVDAGTTGVADQLWWGAGLGSNTTESAVKHIGGVNGEMHYKRCYWWQNGTYATETASSNRSEGTTHFTECFLKNTWHGAVRLGSDYGKCTVKDSVIVLDDRSEALGETSRGVWTFWGPVDIRNTDILAQFGTAINLSSSRYDHESGPVNVYGGNVSGRVDDGVTMHNVGDSPSKQPPAGVPTTAAEAVAGTSSGSSDGSTTDGSGDSTTDTQPEYPHTLSIVGETSNPVNYEFAVTDKIRKTTRRNASIDDEDTIDSGTVSGLVAGGTDSYEFAGSLSSFTIDGNATVYLDGSQVDPSEIASSTGTTQPQFNGTFVIDGSPTPRRASRYEFTVSGNVEKDGTLASINPFDTVDGNTVSGRVIGGKDAYKIDGEITSLSVDGKAQISYTEE